MRGIAVIEAPSILGLKPTGVENLPDALKGAGLLEVLDAEHAGRVESLPYNPARDKETLVLNPQAIREFSSRLASLVTSALQKNQFPLVLGGDCSILIGNLLALRRLGTYGLFFIDGHADFYQPEASPTGEVADMDLAIVSGRGPEVLTDINGLRPLVRDKNIALFGYRDAKESASYGSQDVRKSNIYTLDLDEVRELGVVKAASQALGRLQGEEIKGIWVHLDADVLDDAEMPAVDYRMPGGLTFSELGDLLKVLVDLGRIVGMDVTIFNPTLDADGSIAKNLVSSLKRGLT
jgi:arginase